MRASAECAPLEILRVRGRERGEKGRKGGGKEGGGECGGERQCDRPKYQASLLLLQRGMISTLATDPNAVINNAEIERTLAKSGH